MLLVRLVCRFSSSSFVQAFYWLAAPCKQKHSTVAGSSVPEVTVLDSVTKAYKPWPSVTFVAMEKKFPDRSQITKSASALKTSLDCFGSETIHLQIKSWAWPATSKLLFWKQTLFPICIGLHSFNLICCFKVKKKKNLYFKEMQFSKLEIKSKQSDDLLWPITHHPVNTPV